MITPPDVNSDNAELIPPNDNPDGNLDAGHQDEDNGAPSGDAPGNNPSDQAPTLSADDEAKLQRVSSEIQAYVRQVYLDITATTFYNSDTDVIAYYLKFGQLPTNYRSLDDPDIENGASIIGQDFMAGPTPFERVFPDKPVDQFIPANLYHPGSIYSVCDLDSSQSLGSSGRKLLIGSDGQIILYDASNGPENAVFKEWVKN